MSSFVAALLYLVFASAAVRLREMVRWLLTTMLDTLVDPETGRLNTLHPWYLARMDEMLQDAENWIARALWLHAHDLAGLREPDPASTPPARARTSQTAESLFARVERLAHIIDRFDRYARRTLQRITARRNAPACIAIPRISGRAIPRVRVRAGARPLELSG